jgi:hypothetical protein
MRLRATLAGLLTVILLLLSSVASACEIRCNAARGLPECYASQAVGMQMPAAAGMQDDEDCCGAVSVWPSAPHGCQHQACSIEPALRSELAGMSAHLPPVATIESIDREGYKSSMRAHSIAGRGPPQLRAASPVSLHTTARV